MSTSSSTRSGITLSFVPARMMVGARVVCVQAWAWRASPTIGSSSQKASIRSGSSSGSASSGGKPIPSMNRVHASCSWAWGRYSSIRRTTSAALTRALSVRRGWLPWPGVPRTVSRHQKTPFSPTMTGSRGVPSAPPIGKPPDSVMT